MHQLNNFPIDPVFDDLYAKAGGFERILTNQDLQKVYDLYNGYLMAKYVALGDEISYKFDAKKFEPEVNTMNLMLTMATNVFSYKFSDYKVLRDTLLVDFAVPVANSFTLGPEGETLLQFSNLCQAFLTIQNTRQQKVVDNEPLLDYFRDTSYWPGKGKFSDSRIDWDTSYISFPDATIPNANAGSVILVVVKYIDMKKYPYLQKTK